MDQRGYTVTLFCTFLASPKRLPGVRIAAGTFHMDLPAITYYEGIETKSPYFSSTDCWAGHALRTKVSHTIVACHNIGKDLECVCLSVRRLPEPSASAKPSS